MSGPDGPESGHYLPSNDDHQKCPDRSGCSKFSNQTPNEGEVWVSPDVRHVGPRHPRLLKNLTWSPFPHSVPPDRALYLHPQRPPPPLYYPSRRPGFVASPKRVPTLDYATVPPRIRSQPKYHASPADVVHGEHHTRQVFSQMPLPLYSRFSLFTLKKI